jgi:hypothetical protein
MVVEEVSDDGSKGVVSIDVGICCSLPVTRAKRPSGGRPSRPPARTAACPPYRPPAVRTGHMARDTERVVISAATNLRLH